MPGMPDMSAGMPHAASYIPQPQLGGVGWARSCTESAAPGVSCGTDSLWTIFVLRSVGFCFAPGLVCFLCFFPFGEQGRPRPSVGEGLCLAYSRHVAICFGTACGFRILKSGEGVDIAPALSRHVLCLREFDSKSVSYESVSAANSAQDKSNAGRCPKLRGDKCATFEYIIDVRPTSKMIHNVTEK